MAIETILSGWKYREAGTDKWYDSVAGHVSEIYVDLLANHQIPDPFIDDNETRVQWVAEKTWEYSAKFTGPDHWPLAKSKLVFEGLDTLADVFLNDRMILRANNMFLAQTVKVDMADLSTTNELRIVFHSVDLWTKELELKYGKRFCWNGDSRRLYARKAQYQFGWDWGPRLISCGPYKPVKFVTYHALIENVYVRSDLPSPMRAVVSVDVEYANASGHSLRVDVYLRDPKTTSFRLVTSTMRQHTSFELPDPNLWYPNGHGEQALYHIELRLIQPESNLVLDLWSHKFGIRRIELIEEPLVGQDGSSFFFQVNGVPVFARGVNWIPSHLFPSQVKAKDYQKWLEMAVNANQNIVRVWGGGYYEHEDFYAECDRLGLMVWQDFMFACGQYPAQLKQFRSAVEKEVVHQIKRLRNFACLAIYTGNNEDYQIAEVYGLQWDKNNDTGNYLKTDFPARHIYERLIPQALRRLHPDVAYKPGSPWGGSGTRDPMVGDIHQWDVWHGTQERYQHWDRLGGRFVSEFGMEGLPSMETLRRCITMPKELYPQSRLMDFHNKAVGAERRLATYVIENFKVDKMDLESWVYVTQLMQAECIAYALRSWKRQWKGAGRYYTGGSLIWQMNDCWPTSSWSVVDFYGTPKLAYFALKRESRNITISIVRADGFFDISGFNSTSQVVSGKLLVYFYVVGSSTPIRCMAVPSVCLWRNRSSELLKEQAVPQSQVVYCRLVDEDDFEICNTSDWPQPLKYLIFPPISINVDREPGYIRLSANQPVKGVHIFAEATAFEDNGFDLFPCNPRQIRGTGLRHSTKIRLKYYSRTEKDIVTLAS